MYAGKDVGLDARGEADVAYDDAGRPIAYVWTLNDSTLENERPTIGTASIAEGGSASDGEISWARWHDGTTGGRYFGAPTFDLGADDGFHLTSVVRATDLPTSGTVDYVLAGATAPTVGNGSVAPGTFDGSLSVNFGAEATADFDFTVGIDSGSYNFGATGRPVETSGDFFGEFGGNNLAVTGTGTVCPAGACEASVRGILGGVGGRVAGISYNFGETGNVDLWTYGAAAFVADGSSTPTPTGFTGTRTGQPLYLGRTGNGLGNSFAGTGTYVDGELRRLEMNDTNYFDIGTATVAESGDLGDVAWARWTNGTVTERGGPFTVPTVLGANGGWYVMSGNRASDLPTTGIVNYDLLETTPVAELNGPELGTLTGDMAVQYGAQSTVGFDFAMSYRGMGWAVSTPGGAADPGSGIALESSTLQVGFDTAFTSDAGNVTGTGGACADYCEVQVEGVLFGTGGQYAGVGVGVEDRGSSAGTIKASGLAIFQAGGVTPTPTPTPMPTSGGYTSDFTGTRSPVNYYTFTNGSLATGFGGDAELENGAPVSFTSFLGTTSKGTASVANEGDVGSLAWARWTGGTVQQNGTTVDVGPNGGYHVFAGTPTIALPSSGKVDYELIATTTATDNQGSAPGTITGDLSIAYGSTSLVGYDLAMNVGGKGWAVSTAGGAANPEQSQINLSVSGSSWRFGGTYTSTSQTVSASGGACSASCIVTIGGVMFGDNAGYAGVSMNVIDASNAATIGASGVAIFGREDATTSVMPTSVQPVAAFDIPDPVMLAPQAFGVARSRDWSRWTAVSPRDAKGLSDLQIAGERSPLGNKLHDAGKLLGDMITFTDPE